MFRTQFLVVLLCICVGFIVSCNKGPDTNQADASVGSDSSVKFVAPNSANSESGQSQATNSKDGSSKKKPELKKINRKTLAGRWRLILSHVNPNDGGLRDVTVGLVELKSQADSKEQPFSAKVLQVSDIVPELKLKSFDVKDSTVHLVLATDEDVEFDFIGKFSAGEVRGNLVFFGNQCSMARMVAVEIKNLDGIEVMKFSEGLEDLRPAILDSNRTKAVKEFANKWRTKPIAVFAYLQLMEVAASEELDAKAVQAIVDEYLKVAGEWGDRYMPEARLSAVMKFGQSPNYLDLAKSSLVAIEKDLNDKSWPGHRIKLDFINKAVAKSEESRKIEEAIAKTTSPDKKERLLAIKTLNGFRDSDPFMPSVTYSLAEYAESQKQTDLAIELYAELVALPELESAIQKFFQAAGIDNPLPSQQLERLWKEKNGNTDKLDEFVNQVYAKRIHSFAKERSEPRPANGGNRIALCELFTNARCRPCVAADVALSGIVATYPTSQVIVLQYHQQFPGPDPLSNQDAEDRFSGYNLRGTPALMLNGQPAGGDEFQFSGIMMDVTDRYSKMREYIDTVLKERTEVKIELSAKAVKGDITIDAKVVGLDKADDKLRLHVILAEDEITFNASNGIRQHEMVVRSMPSGQTGIAAKNGNLLYMQTIAVGDLRKKLIQYLRAFEDGRQFSFANKPLDLQKMHVVAFVQNSKTKKIVQAATVPISGDLRDTIGQSTVDPKKSAKPAAEKEATEKEAAKKESAAKESGKKESADEKTQSKGPKLIQPSK